MPQVSIITPCYNSQEFVGRTIESVRAQIFTDWEHLVVDDGSTDGSAAVVEAYTDDPRLRLIRQPNGGVCNARNNGFKMASPDSKYLYFLDADDVLETSMLQIMTDYMEVHPKVGLAYCRYSYIDKDDNLLETVNPPRFAYSRFGVRELPPEYADTPFEAIFCVAPIWPGVSLLRRSTYAQTAGWDEVIGQHGEERDLVLQLALISHIHYVPMSLFRYRRYSNQSSADRGRDYSQALRWNAKWQQMEGLTYQQRRMYRRAWQFYEGRVGPYIRAKIGRQHLQRGEVYKASRHYFWAVRRFLQTIVSRDWPQVTR